MMDWLGRCAILVGLVVVLSLMSLVFLLLLLTRPT